MACPGGRHSAGCTLAMQQKTVCDFPDIYLNEGILGTRATVLYTRERRMKTEGIGTLAHHVADRRRLPT